MTNLNEEYFNKRMNRDRLLRCRDHGVDLEIAANDERILPNFHEHLMRLLVDDLKYSRCKYLGVRKTQGWEHTEVKHHA